MMKNNRFITAKVLWLYLKYQIISKLIVALIAFPIFSVITKTLIKSSGRTSITSGDYLDFLFSLQGILTIIAGIIFLIFVLGLDINTFIVISALDEENRKIRIRDVLKVSIKSVKKFFSPIGIFLVVFIALVLPLLNLGIQLGPLKNFKIPNFITSVIYNNNLYMTAYIVALILLTLISIMYIFTIHFMVIENKKAGESLKGSRLLIKNNFKSFMKDYLWKLVKISIIVTLIIGALMAVLGLLSFVLSFVYNNGSAWAILILLSFSEIMALVGFLSVPVVISLLTKFFYKYGEEVSIRFENNSTKLENRKDGKKKLRFFIAVAVFAVLVVNFGLSVLMEKDFAEIFRTEINVQLVAHRGGGDLGAENTIEGIKQAEKEGASWTEIDVQRTMDGKYIINHDADFNRVADVSEKPSEMTLEEIKTLKVKNEFYPDKPSQDVPTLEEVLDASKGKIGVFVELKGETADEKMVDDVVAMIKNKDMLAECVILSLDYSIIEYTAEKYPEIKTGYLYFFSVGKLEDLKGDYLIMEEAEATSDKIDEIHDAGKIAVVWTVNTEESIQKFIHSDVDGIITDHILDIKGAIAESKKRSHFDIIFDSFMSD